MAQTGHRATPVTPSTRPLSFLRAGRGSLFGVGGHHHGLRLVSSWARRPRERAAWAQGPACAGQEPCPFA